MWSDETCLVSAFLGLNIIVNARIAESYEIIEEEEKQTIENNLELKSTLSKSASDIAEEIVNYARQEGLIGDNTYLMPDLVEVEFWASKGLDSKYQLSVEHKRIIRKAWIIAGTTVEETAHNRRDSIWENRVEDDKEIDSSKMNELADLPKEILAEQLISFVKEKDLVKDIGASDLFWESKGIQSTYSAPVEIKILIKQVEKLVDEKLLAEVENPILTLSDEELSQELIASIRQRGENDLNVHVRNNIIGKFWEDKGLKPYEEYSEELKKKRERVGELIHQILEKEIEQAKELRLENEKKELPNIIQDCLVWAINTKRKRVTKEDLKYFLLENNLDLVPEIKQTLYLEVNKELKKQLIS